MGQNHGCKNDLISFIYSIVAITNVFAGVFGLIVTLTVVEIASLESVKGDCFSKLQKRSKIEHCLNTMGWCVGLEYRIGKGGDTIVLECRLVSIVISFLLPYMLELSLFFSPLFPQIIVMYLQVLECERNQTLVQTAWVVHDGKS